MQFNANKTEEVIFSCKRNKTNHPKLRLGSDEIVSKNEQEVTWAQAPRTDS